MQTFSNNGATTLAVAVNALDTTITVVDASKFPVGEFKVTLETVDRSKNEIVLVTGVAGNVLTVVRAQEGTTANTFSIGDKVENRLTAEWLNGLQSTVAGIASTATYSKIEFTAAAGQTTFSVTYTPGSVEVYRNGLRLASADYTATNGTSIVLGVGASVGDLIEVVTYGSFNVANTYTQAQTDSLLAVKQNKVTVSGIAKWDGAGNTSQAVAGTDYAAASHTHNLSSLNDDIGLLTALQTINGV